ncbi:MAG: SanC, probable [Pseudomonas sp.]|nr:SanC, probable [Pseudomonas sp.]
MIDLTRLTIQSLKTQPYRWAEINHLYSPQDAALLAASYPRDCFKRVFGYGGEKDYEYQARQLVEMGTERIVHGETLSPVWLRLAQTLSSAAYRSAMSALTGIDLTAVPMEINVFHYGPGACLGPHPDLRDKLVTHILYFNPSWDSRDGGCLTVLNSSDPGDVAAVVTPVVGNSAVVVRSDNSWHAVSRVVEGCPSSRRSLTVTFYQPGSVSSMWPVDDKTPLHFYDMDQGESVRVTG